MTVGELTDVERGVARALRTESGLVNLVGALGTGKSTLIASLPNSQVIDMDRAHAGADIRRALSRPDIRVAIDNVDGRRRLGVALAAITAIPHPNVIVVTRRPVVSLPGWSNVSTIRLEPTCDETIAELAAELGVGDRALPAVVRMAAGVPLIAVAAARALAQDIPLRPDGPLADHVAGEILSRLGRELPGWKWQFLLRGLATMGAGDEKMLRTRPDQFDALADLTLVNRSTAGLVVAEPFRWVLETAYRWRDPSGHQAVRSKAAAYRRDRMVSATTAAERAPQVEQALFLHGDNQVRETFFPPGRPFLPIRAARTEDSGAIGELMQGWAVHNGFDRKQCDRLAEQWVSDDVTGFHLIEDAAGPVGLLRLVMVGDRTIDGVEPLVQQYGDTLLGRSRRTLFLGAAFCPHPVAHAQLLRHIIENALTADRLVVSTAGHDYQQILSALRFATHGDIRDDTFRCGKPPVVFSNQFTAAALPGWIGRLGGADDDHVQATAFALARLREPASKPGLRAVAVDELRERMTSAIATLTASPDPVDAESGRILTAYYLGGQRTHVQVYLQLHLSRATYFRRLRHGHAAVARILGQTTAV
ncbi:hypothetical protein [Williamsia sp. CHRR-6]|uniref:hypothetical protein n=1 Tax=Williamsia sp. CHRR-6 TaxID=2835871 RepID=UPI001BDA3F55|nr:hypothetical protein [Williamsia sp. CHRR-6]MBT0567503.1 hypothetical protein [Williamsia sp. CHRR-6]